MKSYKFAERNIHCGDASQWERLIGLCDRDQPGTVLDLRTFLEIGDQQVPKPPEGWGYRRLPLTGATVSEQDLDVFRREFYRKSQTVVVGPNGARGRMVVAASVARLEKGGWKGRQRAEEDSEGEHALLEWLTSYLVRHGYEEEGALEVVKAKRPAGATKPTRPKKADPKAVEPKEPEKAQEEEKGSDDPFTAVEATVEMAAVPSAPPPSLATEPTVELTPDEMAGKEEFIEDLTESSIESSVELSGENQPAVPGAPSAKKARSSAKAKQGKSKGSSKRKK